MLGLVNAIGTEGAKQILPIAKENSAQYGIKLPIPLAQRESDVESPAAAVQGHGRDEESEVEQPRPEADDQQQAQSQPVEPDASGSHHIDFVA